MEDVADVDIKTQEILLAASQHNIESLGELLREGSANVQDSETGFTPLHAAVAACENEDDPLQTTRSGDGKTDTQTICVEKAQETIKLLFQNGAIWNDLDNNDETPGCIAWRLGLKSLYDLIVDAGTRAELLLNRLDEYEALGSGDEEEAQDEYGEPDRPAHDPIGAIPQTHIGNGEFEGHGAAGSDMIANTEYLSSNVLFEKDRLVDVDRNGVMMAWETQIMKRTADILLPEPGLTCLNVGHGLGIIDEFLQAKNPTAHHIIEAHPHVLRKIRDGGWYNKPNVTIHEGRWQDVIPKLVESGIMFDAIYFDTFAEDYKAFKNFFSEQVIGLLEASGKWSFFHGLGADRQICYDVYTKVVEIDLYDAGFDLAWETIATKDMKNSSEWDGIRRKYWVLDNYNLPICTFVV